MTVSEKTEEFDEITSVIGIFGKFQLLYTVLYGLSATIMAFSGLGTKFLTYDVDYWCARPPEFSNMSVESWLNISTPYLPETETETPTYDRCKIFDVNFTEWQSRPPEGTPTLDCKLWEFDDTLFENTIMQRWSLVCDYDKFHAKTLGQSLFFAGATLGAFLIGPLADWYGRRTAFVLSMFVYILSSLVSCFVDSVYVWLSFRFLIGASFIANSTVKTVYQAELTSGSWRAKSHHWLGEIFWQIGYMTTGLVVYLIPDMKMFELFSALTGIPFLLFWFLTPESPRWLLGKGRFEEAATEMEKACRLNKKDFKGIETLQRSMAEKKKEFVRKGYVTDLLRHPAMRRNLLSLVTGWFSCSMGYYGLIYNTPAFEWNLYLVFVFPAFLAIPLALAQPYIVNWAGRKILFTCTMSISGIFLLLTLAIPDGKFAYNWPVIALCWLGTTCSQAAFGVGYVFTKDLFPTSHRTTALSTVSAFARLGSLVSPFIAMFDPITTISIYGSCLLASAAISAFIYPDTTLTKMPETLEESEAMATTKFPYLSWYR